VLGSQCQRDGHYCRQTFRDGSNRDADSCQEKNLEVFTADSAEYKNDKNYEKGCSRQYLPKLHQALLQGCRFLLDGLNHSGNASQSGPHAGFCNYALSAARGDVCAHVNHVAAISQRGVWLFDGFAGIPHRK
jgi:hypothetical protein